jgi:outer membrane protein insertion porin family
MDQAIDRVLEGAGEAGRPFAKWVTSSVELDVEKHIVNIEATLLAGYSAWLGPVTTSLPPGRASEFAVRTSGLRAGAPFRQSDLDRAVDRLLARDLYAQVDEPVVYVTAAVDTVGVELPIIPRRKANRLQVILGLSRREDGGSRLSGQVDLDLPNLAGTGRALNVGWRDDGDRTSRFGFRYLEPLAFGTPLDTDIALDSEVQRDAYTRFRLENRWRLPVVALWGVEVGAGWDRSTYPTGSLERTSRIRVRGALYHRRGDRSRSGWEGVFAVEEAWRSATTRTDTTGALGSSNTLGVASTQRIFEVDVAGELWIGSGLSLFGRGSFRELAGPDGEVPLAEQFRFGGANSLRGYREDEFHGSRAAWGAVELRVGSARGSRLYTFYDLGYFAFETRDPTAADPGRRSLQQGWPRGYGLGIFARTPGGDLSLAVGFPGTVDFDLAKLHVTLLESF